MLKRKSRGIVGNSMWGGLLAVCLFVVGVTAQTGEEAPEAPETETTTPQQRTGAPRCAITSPFAPGDGLRVTVYPDTASFLNGVYPIDDEGCVDLPIVGMIRVVGKSPEQVQQELSEAYVEYLRYPNVRVRPLIRVTLLGGFFRPGLYYVDPRENMWSLVRMAGGTERDDGVEKLLWRRDGEILDDDLVSLFQSGKSLKTIGFTSGDQITVTHRPNQRFWDTFRDDILPVLSFAITAVSSSMTVYISYLALTEARDGGR